MAKPHDHDDVQPTEAVAFDPFADDEPGTEAVAFDPKTGAPQATLKLGAPAFIAPSAYNGALYVLTDSGQLICIR